MNRKLRVIVGAVLVVAAFLLGFVPPYLKGRALESRISAVQQQLESEREKSQADELGLLSGHVYLEAELKNYGLASRYSSQFFDRVRTMTSQAPDSSRQAFLQQVLAQRDSVTGGLARGDPGTDSAIRELFRRSLDNAQNKAK